MHMKLQIIVYFRLKILSDTKNYKKNQIYLPFPSFVVSNLVIQQLMLYCGIIAYINNSMNKNFIERFKTTVNKNDSNIKIIQKLDN